MQKHISLVVALTLLVQGLPAHAEEFMTIEVRDAIAGLSTELTATGLTQETELSIQPPYGGELVFSLHPDKTGATSVLIPGEELQEAGTYTIYTHHHGDEVLEVANFTVLPDGLDAQNSSLQVSRAVLSADGNDSVDVSVILRDKFGNPLISRPVQLISSRADDTVTAYSNETNARGEQLFAVTTRAPGLVSLRAIDLISGDVLTNQVELTAESNFSAVGGPTSSHAGRQLYRPRRDERPATTALNGRRLYGQVSSFDIVDSFVLEVPPQMEVNLDENLSITALDSNGRVVEDYTGTVYLSSTDPNAVLPSFGEVTFRGSDLGQKKLVLGLRFGTPGEHILYAEDSTDPSVNGQTNVQVMGGNRNTNTDTIKILSLRDGQYVNTTKLDVSGEGPSFINLIVTGGDGNYFGETDVEGVFSINVDLGEMEGKRTLQVLSEASNDSSEEVTVHVDLTKPEIQSFTFSPKEPRVGDEVLATVSVAENGSGLRDVVLELNETTLTLEPGAGSGSFQTLITVEESGDFQAKAIATDKAGNATEMLSTLSVAHKNLPTVTNVQTETKTSSVSLTWDQIEEVPVDGYRIYVGETPDDFLYTLDTDRPTSSATVAGLRPGGTYYFAVTVLKDDQESKPSDVVEATVLGVNLVIEPKDGALTLNWNKLGNDLPLSRYELTYGIDPTQLSERRLLNGEMTTHTVRDLINDVTYYFKLTPITTTGDVLSDLAAVGQGRPNGAFNGFTPGPADPAPGGPFPGSVTQPPRPTPPIANPHSGAPPVQPITGIPFGHWWLVLSLVGFGAVYTIQRRRTLRATKSFMQAMEDQYQLSQ